MMSNKGSGTPGSGYHVFPNKLYCHLKLVTKKVIIARVTVYGNISGKVSGSWQRPQKVTYPDKKESDKRYGVNFL